MCGIKYEHLEEQREMDYHLVRAMQLYHKILEGESGETIGASEIVHDIKTLLEDVDGEIMVRLEMQIKGVCIECGKALNDSIPVAERMGLCDECHASG